MARLRCNRSPVSQQSREARLETDLKTTQASQAKSQHLLDSLTNVGTESEKSRSEEKRKLERQVQALQQEACVCTS